MQHLYRSHIHVNGLLTVHMCSRNTAGSAKVLLISLFKGFLSAASRKNLDPLHLRIEVLSMLPCRLFSQSVPLDESLSSNLSDYDATDIKRLHLLSLLSWNVLSSDSDLEH